MKTKLWKEIVIVCVSTLCIITMVTMNGLPESKREAFDEDAVNALVMKSDGVNIGIVASEEAGSDAIEIVKHIYVGSSEVDNIKAVEVNNKISYQEIKCDKKDILNEEEISNKIIEYNDKNEESLVSFTLKKEADIKAVPENLKTDEKIAFNTLGSGSSELYKEVFLHNSLNTPIKGVLTSTFGEQRSGYNHKGIDLAASSGTPIEAALDGTVYFSGVASGYGNVVMVDHGDGTETVYAHCSTLKVSTGEKVMKGQIVAEVGSTGDSTGPHLHFEIRVNGTPVDPLQYNGSREY